MAAIRRKSSTLIFISILLLIILISGGLFTMLLTRSIEPDAKAINQLGTIRGLSQRLVKLELNNVKRDDIISKIDSIIYDFEDNTLEMYGKNEDLKYSLMNLKSVWLETKDLINTYRSYPNHLNQQLLLEKSEEVWTFANDTVLISQINSERKIDQYKVSFLLFFINLGLGILIIYLIKKYVKDSLEYMVNYDGLTNIFNKMRFQEYLNHELDRSQRYDKVFSLIMLDIDHFKYVNDTYGHHVGDEVLKELSRVIERNIRKSDIFARVGGEEFAIITPETHIDDALILSEKLRDKVGNNNFKQIGKITISLGLTEFIKDDSFDSIYKRADMALYESKRGGRNRSEIILENKEGRSEI